MEGAYGDVDGCFIPCICILIFVNKFVYVCVNNMIHVYTPIKVTYYILFTDVCIEFYLW